MDKIGSFTVLEIKQQLAEMMILEADLWDSLYGDTRSGQAIQDEAAREYAGVGRSIQYLKQCLGEIDPDALTIMLTADGTGSMHEVANQVIGILERSGHDVRRLFNDTEYSQLYIHIPADMLGALTVAQSRLKLNGSIEVERTPRIGDLFNWNMARKFLDANPVETV